MCRKATLSADASAGRNTAAPTRGRGRAPLWSLPCGNRTRLPRTRQCARASPPSLTTMTDKLPASGSRHDASSSLIIVVVGVLALVLFLDDLVLLARILLLLESHGLWGTKGKWEVRQHGKGGRR